MTESLLIARLYDYLNSIYRDFFYCSCGFQNILSRVVLLFISSKTCSSFVTTLRAQMSGGMSQSYVCDDGKLVDVGELSVDKLP